MLIKFKSLYIPIAGVGDVLPVLVVDMIRLPADDVPLGTSAAYACIFAD